jgi:hypothetical protein
MCYNCGCQRPDDEMGNPDNITNEDFKKAATVRGMTFEQTLQNTRDLIDKVLKQQSTNP